MGKGPMGEAGPTVAPLATSARAFGLGAVLLLAAVQFAAFVDRAAPSVVAGPLKAEFALTDSQIGALQGPAFALTYAAAMLAAGHWGRRIEPFRLMAMCVVIWTAGGVVFALAQSYPMLMAARMLLGVGQAAFAPAALMVLGSAGVTIGRARAVSMFTTGSAIGRSGSLFLGGAVLLVVAGRTVAGLEPWRAVALALVLPNVALVVGLLMMARDSRPFSEAPRQGLRSALSWMTSEGRAVLGLLAASAGCVLAVQSVGAWMPSILSRSFGMSAGDAAVAVGVIVLCAAPVGHLSAGWLMGLERMRRIGPAPVLATALTFSVAAAAGLLLATTPAMTIAALTLLVASGGMTAATVLIALQPLTPDSIRGGVNAIFLATVSVVGVGLGPWVTGALSDRNATSSAALSTSLAQVVIAVAIVVIPITVWQGRRWVATRETTTDSAAA